MCYGENVQEITFLLQPKSNKSSMEIQNNTKLLELTFSTENFECFIHKMIQQKSSIGT